MNIDELLSKKESAKLDFKREWYWKNSSTKQEVQKKKIELYKDIIALANGNIHTIGQISYLIIGIKEQKEPPHEIWHVDFDIVKLQQEIILNINNYISPSLQDLHIQKHTMDSKDIYIIKIPPYAHPLILKKTLRPPYIEDSLLLRAGEGTIIADYATRKAFEEASSHSIINLKDVNGVVQNSGIVNQHITIIHGESSHEHPDEIEPKSTIQIIFKNLSKSNAIPQMLITSASTNRLFYINEIKTQARKQYRDIYHIALPIDDVSDEEYFEEIADVFGIRETKANRIRRELVRMVNRSRDEVFILITDFENDRHLDDFAKLMRAILDKVGDRLRVITIGGEKLANLKTNMGIHSYFNYFERHGV